MLLAVNIGNSSSRFGVHDGARWIGHWRLSTVPDRMPDEYEVLLSHLLAGVGLELRRIERTVLASVVPPATEQICTMLVERGGAAPLVVAPGVRTGIRIRTDNPIEVGADLVANAVAAYDRFGGACLAVDFGTALSFTAVSGKGDLVGVAIAPGLTYALRALTENTAQLPMVPLAAPPSAIGRNTIHSIQSGVVLGYVGLVESLVRRITSELAEPARVVATGGQSLAIAPLTSVFDEVDPWLTLDGLRLIGERNPAGVEPATAGRGQRTGGAGARS
jgi:type III pantothenate kinase